MTHVKLLHPRFGHIAANYQCTVELDGVRFTVKGRRGSAELDADLVSALFYAEDIKTLDKMVLETAKGVGVLRFPS